MEGVEISKNRKNETGLKIEFCTKKSYDMIARCLISYVLDKKLILIINISNIPIVKGHVVNKSCK